MPKEPKSFFQQQASMLKKATVYLDYNASAPVRSVAKDAAMDIWAYVGNPSSVHSNGRFMRNLVDTARKNIADLLGVEAKRIIFTSGATESNNLALRNFKGRVLVSAIEHDSVYQVRSDAEIINVQKSGVVDLSHLKSLLEKSLRPTLVSIMAANNETGVLQPVAEISHICTHYNAWFHCDAVQAFGRAKLPFNKPHMLSLSAHKLGGLWGAGCLVIDPKLPLIPLLSGGGQERSYRSGTENMPGILAMSHAMMAAAQEDWSFSKNLRDYLEKTLLEQAAGVQIFGRASLRLPNTSLIYMPGQKSETQVMRFDLDGFAVSSGAACSSGKVKPSRVLKAMGASDGETQNSLRVSLSPTTTKQDIDAFAQSWLKVFEKSIEGKTNNA
jgi:cysteine desulfurase